MKYVTDSDYFIYLVEKLASVPLFHFLIANWISEDISELTATLNFLLVL